MKPDWISAWDISEGAKRWIRTHPKKHLPDPKDVVLVNQAWAIAKDQLSEKHEEELKKMANYDETSSYAKEQAVHMDARNRSGLPCPTVPSGVANNFFVPGPYRDDLSLYAAATQQAVRNSPQWPADVPRAKVPAASLTPVQEIAKAILVLSYRDMQDFCGRLVDWLDEDPAKTSTVAEALLGTAEALLK